MKIHSFFLLARGLYLICGYDEIGINLIDERRFLREKGGRKEGIECPHNTEGGGGWRWARKLPGPGIYLRKG